MEQYIESLSQKYGEANINWISKKRKKFVIDFASARVLVINKKIYKYDDIISCRIEKGEYVPKDDPNHSEPHVLLISVKSNTDMLLAITIWSKSTALKIYNLIQSILNSNTINNE